MRMDWKNKHSKMLVLILVICSIPPNFCQLALASSSYISNPFSSPRRSSALTKGLNVRDTRSRTLYTKYSDLKPAVRFNTSAMESEIAAIFKEFAYGSSTSSSSTTTMTTTTSSPLPVHSVETSTFPNYFRKDFTEPKIFIGKQREVHSDVKVTSAKSLNITPEKVSTTSAYSVIENDSAFTYLVNSEGYKKSSSENIKKEKSKPIIDSHTPFDLDDDNSKEVQVRVTSVMRKRGYEAIQQEIGRAWIAHVYVTGISFGIVAAICLLSLSRISTCSQLLPRGYFITLHLMVFLASFLRCLSFLHDPYGAYGRLPSVLTSLLFNSVDPCLTTAYSIVFLVLLRAARIRLVPLNLQSPLVLATVCGIHIGGSVVIDVSSGVLEDPHVISTLNITTQALTAAWGSILCLGYVISFSGIEKAAQRQQGDLVRLTFNRKTTNDNNSLNKTSPKSSLIYASRLFLISTLLHGLLIAFIILNLVTTKIPISATSSEAWAWWTQTSLERIIEIALCILLLATALVLTQSKPRNVQKEKEEKIFSILSNCGRGSKGIKSMDVYPVANEKCNILGNGTLRHSSRNGSMSISKNWKLVNDPSIDPQTLKNQMVLNSIDAEYKKAIQQDCSYNQSHMFSPLQIVHNSTLRSPAHIQNENYYRNFVKEANQSMTPEQAQYYSHLNNCTKTLPGNNYYCSQLPPTQIKEKSQISYPTAVHDHRIPTQSRCDHAQITVYNPPPNPNQYISSPVHYNSKPENEYEVAPYYTHSNVSSKSHVYTKPYSYYPSTTAHDAHPHRLIPHKYKPYRGYEPDPRSEISVCSSSQSEIHVDYLTDASSSNDGLSNTLSRSLTLPLYSHHYPIKDRRNGDPNPDHTPDSAVGLDYSSQVEGDITTPEAYNKASEANVNNPIDFLRLSTTSLNEVLKNQSGFFGKFVNTGNNSINYSPLSLDDTISSPSSEYTVLKKSISTGDLTEPKNSPIKSPSHPQSRAVHNLVDNNRYRLAMNTQPVTSI